jgi:hypothetical protein
MAITAREAHSFDPRQPFSRAEARAAGIGLKTLLSSRFHKIFSTATSPQLFPLAPSYERRQHSDSPPGSFVSHATAARIWSGLVPDTPDVHVTVPGKAGRTSRQGVRAHASADGAAVTRFRNLPITTPEQTFLDLATSLNLVALVVLGDSLIKAGRTSVTTLRDAGTACCGRGAKLARVQRGTCVKVSTPQWRPASACCSYWPGSQRLRSTTSFGTRTEAGGCASISAIPQSN